MGEYLTVTENPGCGAHSEQIERLFQRYRFALDYCRDQEILEVACGGGMGLGYLAKFAKRVVGGDIDESNLKFAREHYNGRGNIELKTLDAQQLPFNDSNFDVVIMYEAIYYLPQPMKFVEEAHRVLRDKGVIIICTANKEWSGFNPSPHSCKYFSTQELAFLLEKGGFAVKMFAGSPVTAETAKDKVISIIKQSAVKLHLIPKTMKGKEILKRLFFGKLKPIPSEVSDGMSDYVPPLSIPSKVPNGGYKVIYAVGQIRKLCN